MSTVFNRRQFIKNSTVALTASSLLPDYAWAKPAQRARLAFIGVGLRGREHVRNTLGFADADIIAICDIDPKAIAATQALIKKAGRKEAVVYGKNERDFENMPRYGETVPIPRYMKTFFERYQGRLLYGTDMGIDDHMYQTTFRILESADEHFYEIDLFGYHWPLQGFNLSEPVLKKLYADNIDRLTRQQKH